MKITSLLRKVNVFDPESNSRRVGALDLKTGKVKTSDNKERPLEDFPDVKYFEKYQNGKQVKNGKSK